MKSFALKFGSVAALASAIAACSTLPSAPASSFFGLTKIGQVDDRYQSYNIEMVEVTGGRFWAPFGGPPEERYRMRPPVDLSNPRLVAMAKHLGPAYVRVSGTWANNTYLPAEGERITEAPIGFKQLLTRDQWRGVVAFSKAVDAKIVTSFPASIGARNADGRWNPEQAKRLIDLTRAEGGSIYGAELFNEPTMPQHGAFPDGYTPDDFARDFRIFSAWARAYAPELKLTGPGGTAEGTMLKHGTGVGGVASLQSEDFLSRNPNSVDIVSYHHYGTVSPRCGPMKFGNLESALLPEFLNLTALDYDFYAGLRDKYEPGKPLWLNETAQAACGGAPWASSFADSFRYLNQLGILAQKGVQVVAHNTLAASDYGLIDQDTLTPRPNYWAAVLWRRTMGSTVLSSPASPSPDVRVYAHCLPQKNGGVGLLAMNIGAATQSLPIGAKATVWHLTGAPIDTRRVKVNGAEPMLTDDGELSGLAGVAASGSLLLSAQSIAFVAVPDAGNATCR
jgi:heparanase